MPNAIVIPRYCLFCGGAITECMYKELNNIIVLASVSKTTKTSMSYDMQEVKRSLHIPWTSSASSQVNSFPKQTSRRMDSPPIFFSNFSSISLCLALMGFKSGTKITHGIFTFNQKYRHTNIYRPITAMMYWKKKKKSYNNLLYIMSSFNL